MNAIIKKMLAITCALIISAQQISAKPKSLKELDPLEITTSKREVTLEHTSTKTASMSADEATKKLNELAKKHKKNTKLAQAFSDVSATLRHAKKNPATINKTEISKTFKSLDKISNKLRPGRTEASLCDCDTGDHKLLCEIKNILRKCCRHLSKEIEKIEKFLRRTFPCDHVHAIKSVPFVITEPGKYCVKNDLVHTLATPAIIIAADNVTLNFSNHSLTLQNPAAVGIFAEGQSEIAIENDKISAVGPISLTGFAIHLISCQKVTIDNILTQNVRRGVFLQACSDATVSNSRFIDSPNPTGATGRGVAATNSTGITVDHCTVNNVTVAFQFQICSNVVVNDCKVSNGNGGAQFGPAVVQGPGSNNCVLTNSEFFNMGSVSAFGGHNFLVDNCSFHASANNPFNLLQIEFGITSGDNVVIRNSTFTALDTAGALGIFAAQSTGLLIENCIATVNFPDSAAIALGEVDPDFPQLVVKDAIVRNCIATGGTSRGIYVFGSGNSGITIQDCVAERASIAGIIVEGSNVVVQNCKVQNNPGNGINIEVTAHRNSLIDNVVATNGLHGIQVAPGALNNHVQGNKVFDNGLDGISNLGTNTETYYNTSCNNGNVDCGGVTPAQPNNVAPVLTGSNICCDVV